MCSDAFPTVVRELFVTFVRGAASSVIGNHRILLNTSSWLLYDPIITFAFMGNIDSSLLFYFGSPRETRVRDYCRCHPFGAGPQSKPAGMKTGASRGKSRRCSFANNQHQIIMVESVGSHYGSH